MPYCHKCGTEVKEEMAFCPKCGAALKVEPRKAGREERYERREKAEKQEDTCFSF